MFVPSLRNHGSSLVRDALPPAGWLSGRLSELAHGPCQPIPCPVLAWLQVSRRLMRKIRATLLKPGNNLGYVKVAVHTYAYLLACSAGAQSSYGPSFFYTELLAGQDAVVREAHTPAVSTNTHWHSTKQDSTCVWVAPLGPCGA